MTRAEVALWTHALRAGGVKGYPFRRQRPVLQYVADFMCKNLNLIIEVDGSSHQWSGAAERDVIRQKRLEDAGFKVIRFTDDEVLNALEATVKRIVSTIEEIEKAGGVVIPLRSRRASPCPLGEGECPPGRRAASLETKIELLIKGSASGSAPVTRIKEWDHLQRASFHFDF